MAGSLGRFDPMRPCLVLAPHLDYPLRNGGDILIDRKWSRFSEYVPFVDIVGKETIKRYRDGELLESQTYKNVAVSKKRAAVNTLLKMSHYLLEKNLTEDFMWTARRYLSNPEYGTVVLSYISTAAVVEGVPEAEDKMYLIESHNDEIKWFENMRKSSMNPLVKLTAYLSQRWVESFLRDKQSDFLFVHVSESDQRGYLEQFPGHESYVVSIGVDILPYELLPPVNQAPSGGVGLIFVGALNVKMNLDALRLFRNEFYPLLKDELDEDLEVLVVGSNPSKGVTSLCAEAGWKLHPDVSDKKLRMLHRTATFSILPFGYATGGKLKLLNSLAQGVPYLATSVLQGQIDKVLYPCLISGDPKDWLFRIREVKARGITDRERIALMRYAERYSWATIANCMVRLLGSEDYASRA